MKTFFIKYGSLLILILFQNKIIAQSIDATNNSTTNLWLLDNLTLIVGVVVVLGVLYTLFNINMMFLDMHKLKALEKHGIEALEKAELMPTKSLWRKAYDWSVALIPVGQESSIDTGHNYDGIHELDNKLPPWWLGLMYGSMIFAVVYMYQYEWAGNWSSIQEYEIEVAKAEISQQSFLDKMADKVNENTVTFLDDAVTLSEGKSIFDANCAACHGFLGEGLIGPNFADSYWIHGGSIKDIFTTIKNGVPEKGMIAWKSQMGPAAMQKVASYIMTLEGTDPPNQKDREGVLYVPEGE